MALIGKIRQNFWFVLIVIGLALAAFVIMDVTSGPMGGGGMGDMTMGSVNGTEIKYDEFSRAENALYSGASDVLARRGILWDYMVEKAIVDQEANDLGLSVSYEEMMDLQFGNNLSPIIQQNFRDPQTQQIDRARLLSFKQSIENGEELSPQFRSFWSEQEKQVVKARLQDKLGALASKAMYTPNWLAQENYVQQNQQCNLSLVKIPYDQIDGAGIELTDTDYKNYINNNKNDFTTDEETRTAHYVVFDVAATPQDSAAIRDDMVRLSNEFKTVANDSLFAVSNNGAMAFTYFSEDNLPSDSLKSFVPNMTVGQVYGPYKEGPGYTSIKLIDKRTVADSIKARHILKTVENSNPIQLAAANASVDSLIRVLNAGGSGFDSLAFKNSDDPSAKVNMGDLGYFIQGTMVPPFNQAVFFGDTNKKYHKVVTQFGVHLIQVMDRKYLNENSKYRIAAINKFIEPSKETQDNIYDDIAEMIGENTYLDMLTAAVDAREDLSISVQNGLKTNDIAIGELGSGNTQRDMIQWLFNSGTSANDVSPEVYTFTNPVKYFNEKYVAIALADVQPAGLQSVASVKNDITNLVMNEKKAMNFKSDFSASSLSAAANQFGVSVDTFSNVTLNSAVIPGLGDEPAVIGEAFKIGAGNMSEPIAGNSGVFVIKPIHITEPGDAPNIPSLRSVDQNGTRQQVKFGLLQALKKGAKINDSRSKFY